MYDCFLGVLNQKIKGFRTSNLFKILDRNQAENDSFIVPNMQMLSKII